MPSRPTLSELHAAHLVAHRADVPFADKLHSFLQPEPLAVFIGSQPVTCKVLLQDFFSFQHDFIAHSTLGIAAALSRIGVFSNNMPQTVCDLPCLCVIGHR